MKKDILIFTIIAVSFIAVGLFLLAAFFITQDSDSYCLDESMRKKCYFDLTSSRAAAIKEANKHSSAGKSDQANIVLFSQIMAKLTENAWEKVRKDYKITGAQLTQIEFEGIEKKWVLDRKENK